MPLIQVTNSDKAMYYSKVYEQLTYVITRDEGETPYCFVFPKSSVLVRPFNVAIRFMWPRINDVLRKYTNPANFGSKNLVRKLSLLETIGVFYLLAAGLLMSLIIFLLEWKIK